jgi:hypothetical protein
MTAGFGTGPVEAAALAQWAVRRARFWLALVSAIPFGLSYGLSLVAGLQESERRAAREQRGAVVAIFYVLAYVGFAAPYLVDALSSELGRPATFGALALVALALAAWVAAYASSARSGMTSVGSRP